MGKNRKPKKTRPLSRRDFRNALALRSAVQVGILAPLVLLYYIGSSTAQPFIVWASLLMITIFEFAFFMHFLIHNILVQRMHDLYPRLNKWHTIQVNLATVFPISFVPLLLFLWFKKRTKNSRIPLLLRYPRPVSILLAVLFIALTNIQGLHVLSITSQVPCTFIRVSSSLFNPSTSYVLSAVASAVSTFNLKDSLNGLSPKEANKRILLRASEQDLDSTGMILMLALSVKNALDLKRDAGRNLASQNEVGLELLRSSIGIVEVWEKNTLGGFPKNPIYYLSPENTLEIPLVSGVETAFNFRGYYMLGKSIESGLRKTESNLEKNGGVKKKRHLTEVQTLRKRFHSTRTYKMYRAIQSSFIFSYFFA